MGLLDDAIKAINEARESRLLELSSNVESTRQAFVTALRAGVVGLVQPDSSLRSVAEYVASEIVVSWENSWLSTTVSAEVTAVYIAALMTRHGQRIDENFFDNPNRDGFDRLLVPRPGRSSGRGISFDQHCVKERLNFVTAMQTYDRYRKLSHPVFSAVDETPKAASRELDIDDRNEEEAK